MVAVGTSSAMPRELRGSWRQWGNHWACLTARRTPLVVATGSLFADPQSNVILKRESESPEDLLGTTESSDSVALGWSKNVHFYRVMVTC